MEDNRVYRDAMALRFLVCLFVLGTSASAFCGATEPRRVLILGDPDNPSAAAILLERALILEVGGDASTEILTSTPSTPREARGLAMLRQARTDLAAAQRSFEALQIAPSVRDFSAATQKLQRVAVLTGDVTRLPTALAHLAASHLLLGQQPAADAVFQRLLALDPTFQPDRAAYNRDMLAAFKAAGTALATQPRVDAELRATPADATLMVDGRIVGTGRAQLQGLTLGTHYLTVARRGYEVLTTTFGISPGPPAAPLTYALTRLSDSSSARQYHRALAELRDHETGGEVLAHLIKTARLDAVIALFTDPSGLHALYLEPRNHRRAEQVITLPVTDMAAAARIADDLLASWPTGPAIPAE